MPHPQSHLCKWNPWPEGVFSQEVNTDSMIILLTSSGCCILVANYSSWRWRHTRDTVSFCANAQNSEWLFIKLCFAVAARLLAHTPSVSPRIIGWQPGCMSWWVGGVGGNEWHWQAMCCRVRRCSRNTGLIADSRCVCNCCWFGRPGCVSVSSAFACQEATSPPHTHTHRIQSTQSLLLISCLISVNRSAFHSPLQPAESRTGRQAQARWWSQTRTMWASEGREGGRLQRADRGGFAGEWHDNDYVKEQIHRSAPFK